MKKNIGKKPYKKAGILSTALIVGCIVGMLYFTNTSMVLNEKNEVETWHVEAVIRSVDIVGEAAYISGTTQWMSFFLLDYAKTPGTDLDNNATDWNASADTMGYVDEDWEAAGDTGWQEITSEDPFYFVCRVKYNDDAIDAGSWDWDRYRVKLTVTGDETITNVYADRNDTANTGMEVSATDGTDEIWINFWWDDGSDGYQITDDGTLDWTIVVESKY
jgi:hypothetical protein